MPLMQQSGPRPVVQCVCNSTGMPPAFLKIIGTRVSIRSGVSNPPGIFEAQPIGLERCRLARAHGEVFVAVLG